MLLSKFLQCPQPHDDEQTAFHELIQKMIINLFLLADFKVHGFTYIPRYLSIVFVVLNIYQRPYMISYCNICSWNRTLTKIASVGQAADNKAQGIISGTFKARVSSANASSFFFSISYQHTLWAWVLQSIAWWTKLCWTINEWFSRLHAWMLQSGYGR